MSNLIVCERCRRHVRPNDEACPFCGATVSDALRTAGLRAMPTVRLGRAALFAFAAASVGAAGCSSDTEEPDGKKQNEGDAATDDAGDGSGGEMGVPVYGAPAAGGVMNVGGYGGREGAPEYGAPPPFPAAGGGVNVGGAGGMLAQPVYGAPFPIPGAGGTTPNATDGGPTNDAAPEGAGGGFVALYGAPPSSPAKN